MPVGHSMEIYARPAQQMTAHQAWTRVNSSKYDDKAIIELTREPP
jgi:hypothetical protein